MQVFYYNYIKRKYDDKAEMFRPDTHRRMNKNKAEKA